MRKLLRNEQGVSAVEYCVLMALLAIALILALNSVGAHVANTFGAAETGLSGSSGGNHDGDNNDNDNDNDDDDDDNDDDEDEDGDE